jgi:hypothetical protein
MKNREKWHIHVLTALLTGILACLTIVAPVSATPMHVASPQHQHLTGCTPYHYHDAGTSYIHDKGTGTILGWVAILADGCGWVKAQAMAYGLATLNHLTLYNENGQAVSVAPYGGYGSSYAETAPVRTNGLYFFAVGVIQNATLGYWGTTETGWANGYWYST